MTEVWSKRRVLPFILILSSNGYEIATDKSFSLSNRKEIGARQLECFFERINRILNLSAQIKLLCLPIKSLPTRIKSEAIAEINFEKRSSPIQFFRLVSWSRGTVTRDRPLVPFWWTAILIPTFFFNLKAVSARRGKT